MKLLLVSASLAFLTPWVFPNETVAQAPPTWRLAASPEIDVGTNIAIHRVSDAALHASGALVIADAGNDRLLVVGRDGHLVRTIGQEGTGPGEFQYPARIAILGDTVVAYDAGQSRVSVFLLDGSHVVTRALPSWSDGLVEYQGAVSSDRYVGTARLGGASSASGLRMQRIAILIMDVAQGNAEQLATRDWQYVYTYTDDKGSTGYATPFLGSTQVRSIGSRIGVVVRGAPRIELLDLLGTSTATTAIPIRQAPPVRSAVTAYRDSLLDALSRSARPFPGAADRVREVFGSRFPVPPGEMAPAIHGVAPVGDEFWVKSVPPSPSLTARWYAVNAGTGEVTRQVEVPENWTILGGSSGEAVVTLRDEFDVEHVRVYALVPGYS